MIWNIFRLFAAYLHKVVKPICVPGTLHVLQCHDHLFNFDSKKFKFGFKNCKRITHYNRTLISIEVWMCSMKISIIIIIILRIFAFNVIDLYVRLTFPCMNKTSVIWFHMIFNWLLLLQFFEWNSCIA